MLTYRLRARVLHFGRGAAPRFPSEAEVCVALEPTVPFGGTHGESRSVIADVPLRLKVNLSTGRAAVVSDTPLFEPLETSLEVANTTFSMKKNVVTVRSIVSSLQDAADLAAAVFYAFPALLNVYNPDPPYPTHAWGRIGDTEFRWDFEPTEVVASTIVTSKKNQEEIARRSWTLVRQAANSRRLLGGLVYFHTACRLLAAGQNRFEFVAEALLNVAKSLQSLFGESRDAVRSSLRELGLFEGAEVEAKFIPALILRNEFDVGHVDLAVLSRDQLGVLHDYANLAEDAFRKLFKGLLDKIEAGQFSLPADAPDALARDKEAILETLEQNIRRYVAR